MEAAKTEQEQKEPQSMGTETRAWLGGSEPVVELEVGSVAGAAAGVELVEAGRNVAVVAADAERRSLSSAVQNQV